jgi:hypothetical protein
MECVFLPDGAMVREQPALEEHSGAAIGKWFAKVYNEEKVFERGTSLKAESSAHIYSRGSDLCPDDAVQIKSFRKRGNFLEVKVIVTGPGYVRSRTSESPWWPLVDLPLGSLPAGVYALEVVWLDKTRIPNPTNRRQITAFVVLAGVYQRKGK